MSLVTIPATFTPASSCLGTANIWEISTSDQYNNDYEYNNGYGGNNGHNIGYFVQGPPSTSDCLPPGYVPSTDTFYAGPCPLGYSTACIHTKSLDIYTVTIATCCPSGSVLPFPSSLLETIHIFTILPAAIRASNAGPRQSGPGNRLWDVSLNSHKQELFL